MLVYRAVLIHSYVYVCFLSEAMSLITEIIDQDVVPITNAGGSGANYLVISSADSTTGTTQASMLWTIHGEACGANPTFEPCQQVVIHYFASNSGTPPLTAAAVFNWTGDALDLMSMKGRTLNAGFVWLWTRQVTLTGDTIPLVQGDIGEAVQGGMCFIKAGQDYITCLDHLVPVALDRRSIQAVVISRSHMAGTDDLELDAKFITENS